MAVKIYSRPAVASVRSDNAPGGLAPFLFDWEEQRARLQKALQLVSKIHGMRFTDRSLLNWSEEHLPADSLR